MKLGAGVSRVDDLGLAALLGDGGDAALVLEVSCGLVAIVIGALMSAPFEVSMMRHNSRPAYFCCRALAQAAMASGFWSREPCWGVGRWGSMRQNGMGRVGPVDADEHGPSRIGRRRTVGGRTAT